MSIVSFLAFSDTQTFGKSKFYSSSENISSSNNIRDLFFDLECSMENKQICRDIFCSDPEKENGKNLKMYLFNYIIMLLEQLTINNINTSK